MLPLVRKCDAVELTALGRCDDATTGLLVLGDCD